MKFRLFVFSCVLLLTTINASAYSYNTFSFNSGSRFTEMFQPSKQDGAYENANLFCQNIEKFTQLSPFGSKEEKWEWKEQKRMSKWEFIERKRQQKRRDIILAVVTIVAVIFFGTRWYLSRKKKQATPNQAQANTITPIITPPVSTNNETIANKSQIDKGWEQDDTISMSVNLLTVEDVINPIAVKNADEKHIKEIIDHVRTIKSTDSNLSNQLRLMLKGINLDNVRSIYKRSLYTILENHM